MTSLRVALKLSMAELKTDEKSSKRKNPMLKETKPEEPTLDDILSGRKRRASFESKDSKGNKSQARSRSARSNTPEDESLTGRSESSGYYVGGENGSMISEDPRKFAQEDHESIASGKNDDASIVDEVPGDTTAHVDVDEVEQTKTDQTGDIQNTVSMDKAEGREAEADAENDGDAEGEGSSSPKPSKKRKKRLPAILKSLEPISGVTEMVAGDGLADDGGAGGPRYQSSRAAAMVAKTKISAKGTGGRTNSMEDLSGVPEGIPPPPARRRKSSAVAVGPQLNWVQCDKCAKWRSVAEHVNNEELPEQWFCSMNTWDLHLNSCDAPEEEEQTTQPTVSAPAPAVSRPRGGRSASRAVEDAADGEQAAESGSGKSGNQRVWVKAGAGGRGRWQRTTEEGGEGEADVGGEDAEGNASANVNADEPTAVGGVSSRRRSAGGGGSPRSGPVSLGRGLSGSSVGAGSSTALASAAPEAVNWVQCNKCRKWRKVPESINVDALPDRWYCSLNTWNPTVARCSARQEADDTTTASTAAAAASAGGAETKPSGRGRRAQNATAVNPLGVGVVRQVQWVQCERRNCKKWRKVPAHIDMSVFPEKWFCEMNTWDPDSATCDAPEPSDSENEQPGAAVSRQQLILGNSKSANALSYRRIIFGTDGRVRVCFSDKNKNGYGIFSYSETHKPSNDSDDYTAPTRRVSYWWSSAYDESAGFAAAQAAQAQAAAAKGKKAAAAAAQAVEPAVGADKAGAGPGAGDASDVPTPTYLLDTARRLYGMTAKPPSFSWPKKVCKSWTILQRLSLLRRQTHECAVVMSCCMAAGSAQVLLSKLLSLVTSCRFPDEEVEACRVYMNADALKAAVKRLEDKGLVQVSYASAGQLSVEVLPPVAQLTQACSARGTQAVAAATGVSPAWAKQGLPLKLRKFHANSKYKSSPLPALAAATNNSSAASTTAVATTSAVSSAGATEQATKQSSEARSASAAASLKPFRLQHRDLWAASVAATFV